MKDVLISIRHEFAKEIYYGRKSLELRKRIPSFQVGTKCFIYESLPIGCITGSFIYGGTLAYPKDEMWKLFSSTLGIEKERFYQYYKNSDTAFGWIMLGVNRFDYGSLRQNGIDYAPQSYCFLKYSILPF